MAPKHVTNDLRNELDEFSERLVEVGATPAGRFIPVRRLTAELKTISKALTESRPTHKCPYCNGRGCKTCKDTGWVPKLMYTSAPMELKE